MNETTSISNHYLSFRLAEELFAVEVSKVFEILEIPQITKIPNSPSYMTGVINLRGSVLPVIDTRIKFNLKLADHTVDSCIVVFQIESETETLTLGALVDSVQEVVEIDTPEIKPSPSIGSKYRSEFIKGIANIKEHFIMILNIDEVLTANDLLEIKETI